MLFRYFKSVPMPLFIALLWVGLLASVLIPSSYASAPVLTVETSRIDEITNPNLKDFLRRAKLTPVDPDIHSDFRPFLQRFAGLFSRLLKPKDGAESITLVVIDDMRFNAGYVRLSNHSKAVFINLGALYFVDNDPELAFVLGHEPEHGPSELQAEVDRLRDSNRGLANLLRRAVENEADVKSATSRVHEAGLSPYGAIHLLERLRVTFPDEHDTLSASHTSNASREDTLSMAIAALRRHSAVPVKEDKPASFSREVLGEFHGYLRSPAFKNYLLQRAQALIVENTAETRSALVRLRQPDGEFQIRYEYIPYPYQSADVIHERRAVAGPNYAGDTFSDLYLTKMQRLEKLTALIFSEQEQQNFQIETNLVLDAHLQKELKTLFGDPLRPQTLNEFFALYALHNRQFEYDDTLPFTDADPRYLFQRTLEVKEELQQLRKDKSLEVEVKKQLLEKYNETLKQVNAKYQRTLRLYEDDNLEELYSNPAEKSIEERVVFSPQKTLQLLSRLKRIGLLVRRNQQRLEQLKAHIPRLLETTLTDVPHLSHNAQAMAYALSLLSDGEFRIFAPRFFSSLTKASQRYLEALPPTGDLHWGQHYFDDCIIRYFQIDRIAAIDSFISLTRNFIKKLHLSPTSRTRLGSGSFINASFARAVGRNRDFVREVFAALLMNHPFVTGADRFDRAPNFAAALKEFIDFGFATPQDFTDPHGALTEIMTTILKAVIRNHCEENKKHFTEMDCSAESEWLPLSRTVLALNYPDLYEFFPESLRATPEQMIHDLQSLAQKSASRNYQFGSDVHFKFIVPLLEPLGERGIEILFEIKKVVGFNFLNLLALKRRHMAFLGKFTNWILEHKFPEQIPFLAHVYSTEYGVSTTSAQLFEKTAAKILTKSFRFFQTQAPDQTLRAQTQYAMFTLWGHFQWQIGHLCMETIYKWFPNEPTSRFEMFIGYLQAIHGLGFDPYGFAPLSDFLAELENPAVVSQIPNDTFIDLTIALLKDVTPSRPLFDHLFETAWARSENTPDLKSRFADPALVENLHYDDNRLVLAKWQLNHKFHIERQRQGFRNDRQTMPRQGESRAVVAEIQAFIALQLTQPSQLRNDLLDYVQASLITNETETAALDRLRLSVDNWHQSRRLVFIDTAQQLSKMLELPQDRLELLLFTTGMTEKTPSFVNRRRMPFSPDEAQKQLLLARRHFFNADIHTRTYLLQPLLNQQDGVFSEPAVFNRLLDTILGGHASDPLYRAVFLSYLASLQESEQRVLIAHIVSSAANPKNGHQRGKVSIRTVLEAMGPFGIKAGQFLRSSGLVSESLRQDLDHFFDHALEPTRGEILTRLREIFDSSLKDFHIIGSLLGSGSINYVVQALIQPPGGGAPRWVVVRLLREGVIEEVKNEDRIWQAAIERLQTNPDTNVQELAVLLNEARAHAMTTLHRNGIEMNAEYDRLIAPLAQLAYHRERDEQTGYEVAVVRPDPELQKLIPAKYSKVASIFEFIPHFSLKDIQDQTLKSNLYSLIVDSELDALLQRGLFDPDGHPGNWMHDQEHKRLVRIDYSQLKHLDETEFRVFRNLMRLLIAPSVEPEQISELTEHLLSALILPGGLASRNELEAEVQRIVSMSTFPSGMEPHSRIFFTRKQLETYFKNRNNGQAVAVRLNDNIRAALSSLGRILIYREQIGDLGFGQLVMKHLFEDRKVYIPRSVSSDTFQQCAHLLSELD